MNDPSTPDPLLADNERLRAALQHIHDYPRGWKNGPSVREFIRETLDQEDVDV